jgi:hypothetical protein
MQKELGIQALFSFSTPAKRLTNIYEIDIIKKWIVSELKKS